MKIPNAMFAAVLGIAVTAPLPAQTSPASSSSNPAAAPTPTTEQVTGPAPAAANSASAASNSDQQIVQLSPFEVSATQDTGYATTETLAGTRIATNLSDVAASISVYDSEFLKDINATDAGSLLQYTTNAVVGGPLGTYLGLGNGTGVNEEENLINPQGVDRIRGLAAADNARDYYITDIPTDYFDVDRVDILRGPNAILFGLGSPAGMVNTSLKDAEFRDFGQVGEETDSWGSLRSTMELNEQLIKNILAIQVDTLWDNQKYEQNPAFKDQKRIYGALRFDPQLFKAPGFHTSIKIKVEAGSISADLPRQTPPADAITAFWRPNTVSASNPFGGEGLQTVANPYDPWQTTNIAPGNGRGLTQSNTANYEPWLSDYLNVQQPYWMIDGTTGNVYGVDAGYMNEGALDTNGNLLAASDGIANKNTNGTFYGLSTLAAAAINYDLPGSQYGQYRTQSLQDPTIFNFYKTLIDGPTAGEWQNWHSENFDFSQTAFGDRLGLEVTYDRQQFTEGGQFLLGGSPTLSIDLLRNYADFYTTGADGETSQTNPNFGRPFVEGANNNGGSSYSSDRKVIRASLYAELRASDYTQNGFLQKLLGTQRFNGVASNEKYYDTNTSWQEYANSSAWDAFWTASPGNDNPFNNRAPAAMIYLGSSVVNRASAAGAYIPGITTPINLQSSNVYLFDPTWKNYTVSPSAPWNVPSSLSLVYTGIPEAGVTTQLYQNSNPANMVGWNSNFQDDLTVDNDGTNPELDTLAEESLRETQSYSGSYQAYLWGNALVATLGWRYDDVGTQNVTAQNEALDRGILNLSPGVFTLPGYYPAANIFKGHSKSGGVVLHLNDLLTHDPLPIDISLSYNDSSNFQVTSVRTDLYGNPLSDPTGQTREYGVTLATKDNRLSLRVIHYDTLVQNDSSTLSNAGGIGEVIQQGLKWRNVFLYQLGGYTFNTAAEPSYRNSWTNAYPNLTAAQGQAQEDQAISTWNNIQTYLQAKGFFQAWNFTPTGPSSALVTNTQYNSNPTLYAPNPATVYSYAAVAPQGFTVTANTESKGYEFDLTANPLPNWRIGFNAAETQATQSNVGGSTLSGFVNYMNSQLYNPDGSPTPAGLMTQFGNAADSIDANIWGPWLSSYTLLKLEEGTDVSELRPWSYNVITNYTFDHGFLKNFGVGGGYRWQDKVVIGYPVNPNTNQFTLSQPYYGPAQGYVDLWASYKFKVTKGIDWTLQLNVTNVGSRDGLLPVSVEPNGSWATVTLKPVQTEYFSNTITF